MTKRTVYVCDSCGREYDYPVLEVVVFFSSIPKQFNFCSQACLKKWSIKTAADQR